MMNPEIETLLSALVGPGSQPDGPDDAKLDYMIMPEEMRVFSMASIPADAADHAAGVAAGEAIGRVKPCCGGRAGGKRRSGPFAAC
jgi:hydrogenase-1 operon protein HyaF